MLTCDECRALLECLSYSIKRVKDCPHQEAGHKQLSLKPLLDLQTKLRVMRDEAKRRVANV